MITIDWKKEAAAQANPLAEIEKAFMDQAYTAVQTKASPIMRSPYKIGFEIVHHSDDNTRLVGIFVFRVNKDLYYAPVFFINGAIKGTDLFYRHTTKSFVPLNERWVEYLISLSESAEGKGVPISERVNTRRQLNLHAVVSPPNSMMANKYASADATPLPPIADVWAEIKAAAEAALVAEVPQESILRRFITNDGGFAAIGKIASAVKANPEFANALFLGSRPENYMPELEAYPPPPPPTPLLTLHQNAHKNANVKSASEAVLRQGYQFEDTRPKAALNEVVYEANDRTLRSVTEPGIYQVLMADGSSREMLCAYHRHLLSHAEGSSCCADAGPLAGAMLPFAVVDLGDHRTKDLDLIGQGSSPTKVLGKFERDLKAEDGVETPETGKMYRVCNLAAKSVSEAFYVESVKKDELGLTLVTLEGTYGQPATTLTLNPDFPHVDIQAKVLGKCCMWVEVKAGESHEFSGCTKHNMDYTLELGDQYAIEQFIFGSGFAKAAVSKVNKEYVVRLRADQKNAPAGVFNKLAAKAAVMTHCAVDEATADEILAKADANERYIFHYEPAESLATKAAHNLRFPQFPEFYDTMNSDYNVQEQPQPSNIMVQADRTIPYIEKHRIGDQMRFAAGDNEDRTMDTRSPMELYGLSQERGVGKMFEHGVVGALTNTFDSASLIETYTPELQKALDRIGRILFLFYWKPEDFAASFGSDDQSQLENKLVSNFKSFGDLLMDLLQKNQQGQQGSSSMA